MPLPTLAELPPPPPGKTRWPWLRTVPPPAPEPGRADAWPRVTIVTPSYNQGQFIEETIRSILLQGYPNLEYIVMDGGSSDGTKAILEKYAPWLTHWQSAKDQGQCDAINQGFARSTGQILTWINSDDYLLPGALFKLAAHADAWAVLNDRERPGLVAGAGYHCDGEGQPLRVFYPMDPAALARDIGFDDPVLQPAAFFTRRLWEELGPLDLGMYWAFDWELWIRALARGAAVRSVPEFLAAAHLHEAQKTGSASEPRFAELRAMLCRNGEGEAGYAALVGAVDRLRPWFARLPGARLRFYAARVATHGLQWRFPRFTRLHIRNLMYNFGI